MSKDTPFSGKKSPPKTTVLLAEDDSSIRRLIEVLLTKANYQVISAEDGLTAMKIAMLENIDAVVADSIMPNLTGRDLYRVLRENPKYEDTPFVLLSGMEDENSLPVANCDNFAFLQKGERLADDLLESLSALLFQEALV